MASQPRLGTFDYTVRDVAIREGWSEQTARGILKDGIDNGHYGVDKHRRETDRELKDIDPGYGRRTVVYPGA